MDRGLTLRQRIAAIIRSTLERNRWNISETARELGVQRSTIQRHLKRMR